MKLILSRDVSKLECPWLDNDMPKGMAVWSYEGCTYGCISGNGRAVSLVDGETPFFELPRNALKEVRTVKFWEIELNGERYCGKTAKKAWKMAKAFAPEWAALRQADFNRAYRFMKKWRDQGECIRWNCHINLYRHFE